jgi:protein tyrosine phosphatase (PTP) superfamily phosphohydrolase (DUF442 family)
MTKPDDPILGRPREPALAPHIDKGVRFNFRGLESIRAFVAIDAKLGTAGQPRGDEFALIRDAGCEAIINLAMPTSSHALPNERELVVATGMRYAHNPVVWENPTSENLADFFRCMDTQRHRNVLVHCALNMRASAFVFLYRVLRETVSIADARDKVREVWEPDGVWRAFINAELNRRHVAAAF